MEELFAEAERLARKLVARGETVAVAESSTGGLVSAALLGVAGASRYFLGGGVVYTRAAKQWLVRLSEHDLAADRAATETHARILADRVRHGLGATWGVGETGAAGPTGNRYGDAPGHSCIAVGGPVSRVITLETGHGARTANMQAFAARALALLTECVDAAPPPERAAR